MLRGWEWGKLPTLLEKISKFNPFLLKAFLTLLKHYLTGIKYVEHILFRKLKGV